MIRFKYMQCESRKPFSQLPYCNLRLLTLYTVPKLRHERTETWWDCWCMDWYCLCHQVSELMLLNFLDLMLVNCQYTRWESWICLRLDKILGSESGSHAQDKAHLPHLCSLASLGRILTLFTDEVFPLNCVESYPSVSQIFTDATMFSCLYFIDPRLTISPHVLFDLFMSSTTCYIIHTLSLFFVYWTRTVIFFRDSVCGSRVESCTPAKIYNKSKHPKAYRSVQ